MTFIRSAPDEVPVVWRERGFKFVIYPNDQGPPHVHALYAGGVAKLWLGPPPRVGPSRGMAAHDVSDALNIVVRRRDALEREWYALYPRP
jgi:Domain of unknown function (DUF4160)